MVEIIKKYWVLILIGLILRLLVAAFTYHPDSKTPAVASAVLFREGSINFYSDYKKLAPRETLDDLPLSYFISIPIHAILRIFIDPNLETKFFINSSSILGNPAGWFYLMYIKIPMIIFDIILGIILSLSVKEIKQKRVLTLWMFNPVTLWATAAIGQADIYPTFFIMLAYFFIRKGKLDFAALSLGFGGAIKSVPFLLIPFILGLTNSWKERIKLITLSSIPYLVTVLPYLQSADFRHNALFAPQLSKTLFAKLPLSGGESVFIVPLILVALYLIYFSQKREILDYLKFSITALLLILSFTHFHLQWFLWITPLLIVWLANHWREATKIMIACLTLSLLVMLFMFDSSLQFKLFAPLFPSLDKINGFAEVLSSDQVYFYRSIAATIFLSSSIAFIWYLFKNHYENNNRDS